MSSYLVEVDRPDLDVELVHHWLSTDAYWARGRSLPVVRRAAAASTNVTAHDDSGALVGYARVVGDGATHAWICDVYVAREHRGRGVGVALMSAVDRHLRELGVARAMLATDDAHGLYARFGFTPLPDGRFLARSYAADPTDG